MQSEEWREITVARDVLGTNCMTDPVDLDHVAALEMDHIFDMARIAVLWIDSFPQDRCNRQWLEQKFLNLGETVADVLKAIPLARDKGWIEIQADTLILKG